MKKLFSKRKLKIIGIVFGALVVVYFALLTPQWISIYKSWKAERNYIKWEESVKEQYRNDIYGGDTPEETWDMFLSALKKRDFDLASKYFVFDKQEKQFEKLGLANEDDLLVWLSELQTLRKSRGKDISQDKEYYYYTAETEEFGTISSSVVFFFNPYSKVWKILGL